MLTLYDFRIRQRDFLLEISRAMTSTLDLNEVLPLILRASVAMLAAEVGLIALKNTNDGRYRIQDTHRVDSQKIPRLNELLNEIVVGAFEKPDAEFFKAKLSQMAVTLDRKLRQSVALPLVIANQPVGLLIVFRGSPETPKPDDIQILRSFADQAAIAVYNAQLYESVNRERQRLAAILEHSADGVMILDANLRILSFNRALQRMTGWRLEDALHQDHNTVIVWGHLESHDLNDAIEQGWPFVMQPGASSETLYVQGDLERLDGLTLSVAITYAPLFSEEGELVNIIANVRDITNFRRAQEMQNVFISSISHELKTPVALIKGYAGTLRRDDVDWDVETIRNSAEVIEDEADRLTELIENLLAASKLQAERMRLDITDVQLQKLAAAAVERFQTQTNNHQFVLSFPDEFPVIRGDESRLRRVIDNLLSNAIKYSPDGGTIEVGGQVDGDEITLYVRDEGIGMSEMEQERIFDRFYRVDSVLSRKTQGAGLGLYLAQAIVDAHNGSIRVESEPGRGSTFYITLPVGR
ncbi:MAG: PAS domain S-box protein [Chloroflexi bacterium]|nr:MAG: histidine kinase [Phototrophicales bacterium]RMF77462.1 MAG: PAS domain S-box protein [Chloroflexota bacterium]